jgi:hypothetical protein
MQRPGNTREQDARRKAEDKFAKAARLDVESMKAREQKQTNDLAKMERLRSLRLAKEAADKVTADQQAVEAAATKRETVAAKAKVVRAKPTAKKATEETEE